MGFPLAGERQDQDSRAHRGGRRDAADPGPLAEYDDAEEGGDDDARLPQRRDHAELRQGVGVDHQAVGSHRAEPAEVADPAGGAHLRRKTWAPADDEDEGDQELGAEQPALVADGAAGNPDLEAEDDAVTDADEAGGNLRTGRERGR